MAQDPSHSIASALHGHRKALVALARKRLGWTREQGAALRRGDPEAAARA